MPFLVDVTVRNPRTGTSVSTTLDERILGGHPVAGSQVELVAEAVREVIPELVERLFKKEGVDGA